METYKNKRKCHKTSIKRLQKNRNSPVFTFCQFHSTEISKYSSFFGIFAEKIIRFSLISLNLHFHRIVLVLYSLAESVSTMESHVFSRKFNSVLEDVLLRFFPESVLIPNCFNVHRSWFGFNAVFVNFPIDDVE